MRSLLDQLASRAAESPNAPAVRALDGRAITRAAFVRRTRATAAGLALAGMRPGDRVLIAVRFSTETLELAIAILELGGVLVPLDTGLGESVFDERMTLIAPTWVIAESVLLAASASRMAMRFLRSRGVHLPRLVDMRGATFVRVGRWMPGVPRSLSLDALRRRGEEGSVPAPALEPTAPAIIVCTSGTTGAPNAVVHSRRSVGAIITAVGAPLAFDADDVVYAHELHTALPALLAGATVLVSKHSLFVPRQVIGQMKRHGVTCWFAVTSDCNALAEWCAARGTRMPATLRQLIISSAPVRAPFLRRLRHVLAAGTRVWCVYGLTEMVPVAYVDLDEKLAYDGEGDLVGPPLPGISARLAHDGELLLAGPNLCSEYLGHPPLRELATGDLARIDEGRVVLLGRRKDMMIRGSHNIYPELYEPAIERIAGVRRCAMVGVYDETAADERIVLGVEAQPGVDERALKVRVGEALRRGASRIDDAAYPDLILVAPLSVCGRSSKVDRERLRTLARGSLACASR